MCRSESARASATWDPSFDETIFDAVAGPDGLVEKKSLEVIDVTMVRTRRGDVIELDVPGRKLELQVRPDELEQRRAAWRSPVEPPDRGYTRLFFDHVLQADEGVDFDFLVGKSGSAVPKPNH